MKKEQNKHRIVNIFLFAYKKRTPSSPSSAERAENLQRIMGRVNLKRAHYPMICLSINNGPSFLGIHYKSANLTAT